MSNEIPQNRRRSQRIPLQVAVVIRTEAPGGEHAQLQAFTAEVSAHGGSFELPLKLAAGQKITLISPHTGREIGCRIVSVDRAAESGFTIGFEFNERCPQFWPVSFVPKDWEVLEKVKNDIH